MTPVEQVMDAANRRHFREISVAANAVSARSVARRRAGCCADCGKPLGIAELIELFCEQCGTEIDQNGGSHG